MFKNYDAVSYLYEKRLAKENEPFAEKFIASIDNANNIEIKVTDLIIIIKALNILPLYQSQIAFNKLYSVNPMLANRILEMADELPNKSEFEHRNQLRQLVARYVFLIQSSILTRVFSKDRRKFILNALGTNIPANINEVISRILKELECNFKVNGGIANIFSLKNKLIPYIFKHASRVKYASLKSEIDGITGQKTQEAPYYSTYALYSLDVILQLINKHNKEFLVDSLDLKGLDFTVTPMKVEEFKPKINNIFNIEFVNDGKIHGSIEDINSVINLNSLYKDLTYIESLCGVNYEKAVKIANDILCSLDNTLYHPDANFLQPFSEDVKKGLNTAIALLGGNPIKLNSEKSALKDFDYDNLDKYHIPDLPKLPDLPEFPDTSD